MTIASGRRHVRRGGSIGRRGPRRNVRNANTWPWKSSSDCSGGGRVRIGSIIRCAGADGTDEL